VRERREKERKSESTELSSECADENDVTDAEEAFVEGVLTRGEAAKPEDGDLPPGVTHEIVEDEEGKVPKIRRRRFSAF
jgi:hypothetical protein